MRIEIYPRDQRSENPDEAAPVRLRRRVLEALYDQDLPLACEIAAAADAEHATTTDPAMIRALAAIRRYVADEKAATLRRLKKSKRGRSRKCGRCLRPLGETTKSLCPTCRSAMSRSHSVHTVSGGLPTLGSRRR